MKFSIKSLILNSALLAFSGTTVAEPQPDPVPLAPAENGRPAERQPTFSQSRLSESLDLVRSHRIVKNFALAMSELDALKDIADKESQARIQMARAEVYYEMENYGRAREEIERVIEQEPKHPDALILRGKVLLKMREDHAIGDDFIDANVSHEVKFGNPIVVNLLYPSVEFNGDIELVITSGLGDRETLTLQPIEADKNRYRAQLPTKNGKPQAGDKVLQTQVGDEITIEYSPSTKAKMNDIAARAIKCKVVTGD